MNRFSPAVTSPHVYGFIGFMSLLVIGAVLGMLISALLL